MQPVSGQSADGPDSLIPTPAARPPAPEPVPPTETADSPDGDLSDPEREALWRRQIAAGSTDPRVYTRLAALCGRHGRWQEVELLVRRALVLAPDDAEAHNALGIARRQSGDLEAAIACHRRALAIRPDFAAAHCNLGTALQERGDLDAAGAQYRQAIARRPDFAEARTNLGFLLLLQGDYAQGWQEWEWRHSLPPPTWGLHARPGSARWDGAPLPPERELLLVCEQGLGDTLQFMRYAEVLRRRGLAVRLCAQPPLHDLIRSCGLDDAPLTPAQAEAEWRGPWLPLLSLPEVLGVRPDRPLLTDPWIRAEADRVERWRPLLAAQGRPVVALAWQGNPAAEHTTLRGRSLPLDTFAVLAERTDVAFVSLQKGFGAEQLENCPFRDRFVSGQAEVDATWDFRDSAAILACCDLVICSDTALAHLAGGMGLPTWLLLRDIPDWRWGLVGETSFWYPSLRLFRQERAGDWPGVLGRVADELRALRDLQRLLGGGGEATAAAAPTDEGPIEAGADPRDRAAFASRLGREGRWRELQDFAEGCLRRDPESAEAHDHLGIARQNQGDAAGAVACHRRALALQPDRASAWLNLGNALQRLGDLPQAIDCYRQALSLRPEAEEADRNLGQALLKSGDGEGAADCFRRGLARSPHDPEAHNLLGQALFQLGDTAGAGACFRQALALRPDHPSVLCNLGAVLQQEGQLEAARSHLRRAVERRPEFAEAHNNLAVVLQHQDQTEAAIASFHRALALRPGYADAYSNLGNALMEAGDLDGARASYRSALALDPAHADAHNNLAHALLLCGAYDQGWPEYEWRGRCRIPVVPHAVPATPVWDGRPLAPGETLLLVSEQGLGDTLQFMRYVGEVRRRGIAVRLCAQTRLHGLIQASGLDERPLSPEEGQAHRQGPWLPLLSLPGLLGVSAAEPLVREPYLRIPAERIEHWRSVLAAESRPLVAINWQGNPSQELTGGRGRSLPLETFAVLAERTDVSFVSLQKGFGSEQLATCSFRDRFVGCQERVDEAWDFLDTAAILACCDLVISSDTAVAHLAAGLGHPTWLLLKHIPEWRWGLSGDSSGWYPSMRLFRQRRRGDWREVLERVAGELRALQDLQALLAAPPAPPTRTAKAKAKAKETAKVPGPILAPVSLGELIDKITILEIKEQRLRGAALAHVRQELAALRHTLDALELTVEPRLVEALRRTNASLWEIEDAIREQERRQDFGAAFVQLARSVYHQNDRRAAIKREINTAYGSALIEEKSYADYGAGTPPPDADEPHGNGIALLERGDAAGAIACFHQALALRPAWAEAHASLGTALLQHSQPGEAVNAFRQALALRPEYPEALLNLGLALQAVGDPAGSLAAFEQAVRQRETFAEAHFNLANLHSWRGDAEAARAGYRRAVALRPDLAEAHHNLASTLLELGDAEGAVTALERTLALRPDFPEARLNLGNARQAQGDLAAAMACFREAERQRPGYAEARLNLGLAQLLGGDYAAGWEGYEGRFETHGGAILPAVPGLERWRGEPQPPGEPLLLVAEQGLGDTLQFLRYVEPLREGGLSVRLCAPARLHGLIRTSGIDPDPLTAEQIGSVGHGRWLPLLSLPGRLGVRPDRPLRDKPYLRADPARRETWRGLLAAEGHPVIGLHWQGNPAQERQQGRGRSLPLEAFAPLAGIDGIRLLSLQKGFGAEQLATCSFRDRFVECQARVDEAWDFEETAAIVAGCDLLITSDSAVAHLAAGLGHPTWLLLKHVPDWRWGLEGETSFWYPASLRLFRQRRRGDWGEVIGRVADALRATLGGR